MPFTLFFFAALLAALRRSALSVFKFYMNNTTSFCAVSVRQTEVLPQASFRLRLTTDALALS